MTKYCAAAMMFLGDIFSFSAVSAAAAAASGGDWPLRREDLFFFMKLVSKTCHVDGGCK